MCGWLSGMIDIVASRVVYTLGVAIEINKKINKQKAVKRSRNLHPQHLKISNLIRAHATA